MSDHVMFDTLVYAKRLKAAGLTENLAEVQAEALAEIIDERLAAKQDIRDLQRDIKEMAFRLKHDLTLRLGTMIAASMAIVVAIVKLIS